MVSVSATVITFDKPGGYIGEGGTLKINCTTDEGNPVPVIQWTQNGAPVTVGSIAIQTTYGYKTESVYTVVADRTHNGVKFACYLANNMNIKKEYTATIKCK
jgi:hypothetical protein